MSPLPTYQTVSVTDRRTGSALNLFYREAGEKDAPAILLLHGFPTSSHQYRGLIDRLAGKYRVIAPDLPGFGFSDAPDAKTFGYTFDHLAEVIENFTDVIGLKRYALYVFDYGAPVGFRLATSRPERVTALISQNGNAYEEGLSDGWKPIRAYWQNPTDENRANLRAFLKAETTNFQYTHGESDTSRIPPELYARPAFPRPSRQRRNSARPLRRLQGERHGLLPLPRVFPHPPSADARCLGQERSVLPARRRRGFPTRHPERRNSPCRCGAFPA
jgi:pimeloyl-ACP methyl ester carboxylesterase